MALLYLRFLLWFDDLTAADKWQPDSAPQKKGALMFSVLGAYAVESGLGRAVHRLSRAYWSVREFFADARGFWDWVRGKSE